MTVTATEWTVDRPRDRPLRCLVSQADGGWDVIVWTGPSIVLWERRPTREAASSRADELWTLLAAHGAISGGEPDTRPSDAWHAYRRACPECRQAAGRVTHVRGSYAALACEACEFTWSDRRRTSLSDRRTTPRLADDRRKAA